MQYNPEKHHRRSVRLHGWDYAGKGTYFITLCVQNRECLFGDIVRGEMLLNGLGNIVREEWNNTPEIRHEISLDAFMVMPNHIHGIVIVNPGNDVQIPGNDSIGMNGIVGARGHAPLRLQPRTLGSLIIGFKSITTKRINALRNMPGIPLWQRNYHEHIIRNDDELNRIRKYIFDNPRHWESEHEKAA